MSRTKKLERTVAKLSDILKELSNEIFINGEIDTYDEIKETTEEADTLVRTGLMGITDYEN